MSSLNQVILLGRLTAAPEIAYVGEKPDAVANFSLAVNLPVGRGSDSLGNGGLGQGNSSGPRQRKVETRAHFFDCEVWGGWAENLHRTATKGSVVLVEGQLIQDRWQDRQTGAARSRIRVRARKALHVEPQYFSAEEQEELDRAAEVDESSKTIPDASVGERHEAGHKQ